MTPDRLAEALDDAPEVFVLDDAENYTAPRRRGRPGATGLQRRFDLGAFPAGVPVVQETDAARASTW